MRFIIKDTCRQKKKPPINASCVGHILTQCRRTKRCRLRAAGCWQRTAQHFPFPFSTILVPASSGSSGKRNVVFANNLKHTWRIAVLTWRQSGKAESEGKDKGGNKFYLSIYVPATLRLWPKIKRRCCCCCCCGQRRRCCRSYGTDMSSVRESNGVCCWGDFIKI